jgi:hypothetical protein
MKTVIALTVALATVAMAGHAAAQEEKPVPKDSVRVFIPGCTKGMVFTAGPVTEDQPGRADIREGTHLRMQGPKKLMKEITAHQGQMIGITGLMRKGQGGPGGLNIGGVHIMPAQPTGGGLVPTPMVDQPVIDVESWRLVPGVCRAR